MLPLLLGASFLALNACSQLSDKWTAMQVKGVYQKPGSRMQITDKKVIMSDADTAVHIKLAFNYEVEGKQLLLEPSSAGGLGGLAAILGITPEIEIVDKTTLKYKVNGRTDIYKRME
jgi:hypothetical protein